MFSLPQKIVFISYHELNIELTVAPNPTEKWGAKPKFDASPETGSTKFT